MQEGRPPIFQSVEELQLKVDEYFEWIEGEFHWEASDDDDIKVWDRSPEPATITGMCLFLGFESRQSFHDYAKNDKFSYTIKRARLRIENSYEKSLNYSRQPVAQIFALKNLGWEDKATIAGDAENPLVTSNLSNEELLQVIQLTKKASETYKGESEDDAEDNS